MKKFKWITAMVVGVITLFTACNNALQINSENLKFDAENEASGLNFVLTFPRAVKSRNAFYSQSDVTLYCAQIVETGTSVSGAPGQTVSLSVSDVGSYTIKLTAYKDSTIIAEGESKAVINESNNRVKVNIHLKPKQKDYDIDLEIEWDNPDSESNGKALYTVLPAGTNGSAGTSATYVLFGEFPQSEKATSVSIDFNVTKNSGAYTYYKGSDDAWYAELKGKYYKVEPIKWRVLTTNYNGTGKKLLLSENALVKCVYNDNEATNIYQYSNIRAYLNGLNEYEKGFLQTAFTLKEQDAIAKTVIIDDERSTNPDDNPTLFDNGNNPNVTNMAFEDKIFLLSVQEVTKKEFGFDSADKADELKKVLATDFGIQSSKYKYPDTNKYCTWWLRSPASHTTNMAFCGNESGYAGQASLGWDGCAVPALCID